MPKRPKGTHQGATRIRTAMTKQANATYGDRRSPFSDGCQGIKGARGLERTYASEFEEHAQDAGNEMSKVRPKGWETRVPLLVAVYETWEGASDVGARADHQEEDQQKGFEAEQGRLQPVIAVCIDQKEAFVTIWGCKTWSLGKDGGFPRDGQVLWNGMTGAPWLAQLASSIEQPSYDVGQLVTTLTEEARDANDNFDPSALVKALEDTISALLPLRQKVTARAQDHESAVRQAERDYTNKLSEFKDNFQAVSASFTSLESRISEVGRTAIKIGDQLESIDRLKQRALEAQDVIQFYFDFANRGDSSRIEALRKEGGREGRAKVAIVMRRLAALAKEVEDPKSPKDAATRAAIEKYCESFEKEMLKLFDRYYRRGDPKGMAHCAKVLLDFNGCGSCVQAYISQHDFFISRERMAQSGYTLGSSEWEALSDPDSPAPKSEAKLTDLFAELRETVAQEAQIIQAVFPHPAVVMQSFLQRVFAQVIQTHVEQLLSAASAASSLAFLRMLKVAHQSTSALIEDLKAIDLFKSPTAPVTHMLDQALEDLFPQTEGTKYMERETKNLNELYAGCLLSFMNWHREQNKGKPSTTKTVFDRMVTQLTDAAQRATSSSDKTGPPNLQTSPQLGGSETSNVSGLKALMKLSSKTARDASGSDRHHSLMLLDPRSGQLQLEVADRMLKWHAEAVGRMVDLSPAHDVPKNTFALLKTLSESYGRAYIETSLSTALSSIATYDGRSSEPDLAVLEVVCKADMVMSLFQKYVSTALSPLASSSVTLRREMAIFVNHMTVRIEGRINELLQRAIENACTWFAYLLATKQKKQDYRPKNDDLAFTQNNSEACTACREFLVRIHGAALQWLSGKNREVFLTEIGNTFHFLLLENIKKLQISTTGGLLLTKDLADYQETVQSFDVPVVTERFTILRQLANIFIVRPETIRSYLSESYLARMDPKLLKPFLTQRVDYGDYRAQFWTEMCGENSAIVSL